METQTNPKERELEYWTINIDGSLQLWDAGTGILVTSPKGESFKYVLQMHFPASNNAAEYEALLHGLRIATVLGIRQLKVLRDPLLIVNQANRERSKQFLQFWVPTHSVREDRGWVIQARFQSGYGSHRGLFAGTPWAKYFQSVG
jgi:hypothetical protein